MSMMDVYPQDGPHVGVVYNLKSQNPDLLCRICRTSVAMEGFRIVCDLSDFFGGIRKRSFLYIDVERLGSTIQDLCFRIRTSFNIKECVALMIDDVFLPFLEYIKILRPDDVVKVVLLDASSYHTGSKTTTAQQNVEANQAHLQPPLSDPLANFVNGNAIPQRTKQTIQTLGEISEVVNGAVNDTPFDPLGSLINASKSLQKKRRRKHRSAHGNIEENHSQLLTEIILDSSEVAGLDKPHEKKKRKNKNVDIEPDEGNVEQGLADTTPEIVSDLIGQSSAEMPTSESFAVISNVAPGTSSLSRKRKRVRCRKKKPVASDIPAASFAYPNYFREPAINPFAKAYVDQVDSNLSHIRFSSSPSNEVENNSLDYNPLEDDLLEPNDALSQVGSTTEDNGFEINGIKSSNPNVIASGSGAPLVVRRRSKIDSIQPLEGAKVRKFLQKPPEINDIITFKIWKMDQNYCPQISGLIKAKVLNFCNDSQQLRFFILDGKTHCEQPHGKFSLDVDFSDDGPPVPPIIPDIMELNWQEMLEVEIFL